MTSVNEKNHPYSIIPEPVQIIVPAESGSIFQIKRGTCIFIGASFLRPSAEFLADYCRKHLGIPLQVAEGCAATGDRGIFLSVSPERSGLRCVSGNVSGGYRLTVCADNGVVIDGNDAAGVFYGVQTLIQMLPTQAGVLATLPDVEIIDYPRFEYRGMHLDVVRHFFPVEFIKRYIDYIALHKMNFFHWHLTDDQAWRVEMKSHPELTELGSVREGEIEGLVPVEEYRPLPYGGYYTQDEVREVIEYAAQRYITVIPEIDIPGHCMALLAVHPEFSTTPEEPKKPALHWRIFNRFNNVLAPKPEVFAFLTDVFSELCDLFPGQYVHLGGDECSKIWWKDSEETQRFMRDNGLEDEKALQSYIVHYVQDVVNGKGKTVIGWDDILEGNISADCVIMNWRSQDHGAAGARRGHRVVSTCEAYNYFNYAECHRQEEIFYKGKVGSIPLEKVYGFPIVPEGLSPEEEKMVWGGQGCVWAEYLPYTWKVEYAIFPRLAALAENLWTLPSRKNWDAFAGKIPAQCARYELWGARYSDAFFRQHDILRRR